MSKLANVTAILSLISGNGGNYSKGRRLMRSIKGSGILWYRNPVEISLWWTSPKAFFKSSKVTINERCYFFDCLIKWASWAVCSNFPNIPGVKPFWTEISTYSFFSRNSYILLRIADVNLFKGTDCKVIDLKLPGSSVESFLWINIVIALFQIIGILPDFHTSVMISVKLDRR